MNNGEIILYNTEDGLAIIQLKAARGTVWLNQIEMAELFDTTKQNISLHIKNLLVEGEVTPEGTIKESLTVQVEGERNVERQIQYYNLDIILAVGYRVRSPRGTQFRRWANGVLKEYLVKGFVMDDERLKDPEFDYFDELLERIQAIRASEAQFYRKVRDILALSDDYEPSSRAALAFYATIQNKMLYAVTTHTAAELIIERSSATAPNMGLTAWKHGRVRKDDVTVAKNYLGDLEIRELNQIVSMFLDTADLRARRRLTIKLAEWEGILDRFLASNELPVLHGAGNRSKMSADTIAHRRYAEFDAARKEAARKLAESEPDIDVSAALGEIEQKTRQTRRSRKPKSD
ncbi:virulence RhuM family protein [Acetobacter syzygii]|uniref:Hydroxyacid dehydrogenase n=1 Tax=Acetobacter syzygii TaxID=146476 RepID=A0A270BFH2_9PROT|nr:virulence RhuM family protein [Acetobacter syzygii]PAL23787.1 hydroxyacid dehydrogenase [Acetobacter syzygii]PAL24446.1 hydroxyacid dehydrogenase [Acetobacter syzygii]